MDAAALSTLANRLYAAEVQAAPQVEEAIRVALYRADGASSPAWGLALVMACWIRQNEGDSLSEISGTGVAALIDQIKSFEGWFPRSFQKFRDTAQAGGDRGSIAAAASYFTSALKDLGSIAKQGFLAWLASPKFTTVASALAKRFGGPLKPSEPAQPNPAKAFDHADYRVVRSAVPAAPPPSAPAARLVEAAPQKSDLLLASLLALGWSPQESEKILAGPGAQKSAASGPDRPRPEPDPQPDKKAAVQSKQSDASGIPGVIKSGIDLARDIFKTVTATPPPGRTNGQTSSKPPSRSKPADRRMSEETPGDFGSGDEEAIPGTRIGEDDSPEAEPGAGVEADGRWDDTGRITDPSSYVNDSSEVID